GEASRSALLMRRLGIHELEAHRAKVAGGRFQSMLQADGERGVVVGLFDERQRAVKLADVILFIELTIEFRAAVGHGPPREDGCDLILILVLGYDADEAAVSVEGLEEGRSIKVGGRPAIVAEARRADLEPGEAVRLQREYEAAREALCFARWPSKRALGELSV